MMKNRKKLTGLEISQLYYTLTEQVLATENTILAKMNNVNNSMTKLAVKEQLERTYDLTAVTVTAEEVVEEVVTALCLHFYRTTDLTVVEEILDNKIAIIEERKANKAKRSYSKAKTDLRFYCMKHRYAETEAEKLEIVETIQQYLVAEDIDITLEELETVAEEVEEVLATVATETAVETVEEVVEEVVEVVEEVVEEAVEAVEEAVEAVEADRLVRIATIESLCNYVNNIYAFSPEYSTVIQPLVVEMLTGDYSLTDCIEICNLANRMFKTAKNVTIVECFDFEDIYSSDTEYLAKYSNTATETAVEVVEEVVEAVEAVEEVVEAVVEATETVLESSVKRSSSSSSTVAYITVEDLTEQQTEQYFSRTDCNAIYSYATDIMIEIMSRKEEHFEQIFEESPDITEHPFSKFCNSTEQFINNYVDPLCKLLENQPRKDFEFLKIVLDELADIANSISIDMDYRIMYDRLGAIQDILDDNEGIITLLYLTN